MIERKAQIRAYLPVVAGRLGLQNPNNVAIQELPRGGYNVNYLVTAGGKKFLFRLNLFQYIDVPGSQLAYEYGVLRYIDGRGLAPKAFLLDISQSRLPYDLMVEEFVPSKPLNVDLKFLEAVATKLKTLHSLVLSAASGFLLKNSDPLQDQWAFIRQRLGRIPKDDPYRAFLALAAGLQPSVEKYVAAHAPKFRSGAALCVNHKDLALENILQAADGPKFIDWQATAVDDASYDLAYFLCDVLAQWDLGRSLTAAEKSVFLESYGADPFLRERIALRLPLLYLEQFVWVTFRHAYFADLFKRGLIAEADKAHYEQRLRRYEQIFLDEKMVNKYLQVFN